MSPANRDEWLADMWGRMDDDGSEDDQDDETEHEGDEE